MRSGVEPITTKGGKKKRKCNHAQCQRGEAVLNCKFCLTVQNEACSGFKRGNGHTDTNCH